MNTKTPADPAMTGGQLELPIIGMEPESMAPSGADVHPRLQDAASVLKLLDEWHAAGWLQQLDVRFARFLHTEQPDASALLLLAAALASHQLGRGHVCLDLAATLSGPDRVLNLPPDVRADASNAAFHTPRELLRGLTLAHWEQALQSDAVSDGSRVAPLVYDGHRLYLYRYWQYERRVAQGIAARIQAPVKAADLPVVLVREFLDVLFGQTPAGHAIDWQRLACAMAARQRFSIVTGGPGTGKTTTVVRLLALMQALHHEQWQQENGKDVEWRPLRIQLAAPTGKAAARLSESIAGKVGELPLHALPAGAALAQAIPVKVQTLHRLLGGRPHVQARRYNADNPLPLDVLVIDEASMVSLSDMAHVIAALPRHAKLVLIGDKDQLSSVEAGAVLGELCRRAEDGHYLPETAAWLEQATGMALPPEVVDEAGKPLDQAVAMLRVSHRFDEDSGIGQLASAVNAGQTGAVRALLARPPADLAMLEVDESDRTRLARVFVDGGAEAPQPAGTGAPEPARRGYGHYLSLVNMPPVSGDPRDYDAWAADVLSAHRASQVLCVVRNGPWGVEGLNASIAHMLHARGLVPAVSGWYAGRPVMVTRNNPALRLTNGDIGVVLPYPVEAPHGIALRVAFPDGEGTGVRWFAPNRLDDVETVYALTVHKSQGSEFHHAILVLPSAPTPVLTRELLYTGITRASQWFTLVNPGGPGLLRQAVEQRVYRSGGLGDALDALR